MGRRYKKKNPFSSANIISNILVILVFVIVIGIVAKVGIPIYRMYREATDIIEASTVNTFKVAQTSLVYDIKGSEIKKLKGEKDISYVEYDDISDAAKLAMISIEDKNFTEHHGVDVIGVVRSVVSLIVHRGRITMGGSTITQQLVKNMYLTFEQTYTRKLKEMFMACAMEKKYSKEQILEFYLNNVYFSNGYYGIESASEAYFNKKCKDLTISQTAFLCAIPNGPNRYDPYVNAENTLTRRDRILTNMYHDGYINRAQYEKSLAEEIVVMPKKENVSNDYAETYIIKCATEALMESQGFQFKYKFYSDSDKKTYDENYDEVYQACKQSLYTGGYRIYTSIDMDMQKDLQDSVSRKLGGYFLEKTDDGIFKVQGAAVCIDNRTGRVNAIVGGREEDQEGYGLNRAYQANRQPGSAIKPLLVFAPALQEGYSPDSLVDDSPMTGPDKVRNAGDSYAGTITLRKAVQKSSNVVTYRMYQQLGSNHCLEFLERMNFAGLDKNDYKYDTTCIGGFTNGTTPVEMAAGYATLANDGVYRKPTCIDKIEDAKGNLVVEGSKQSERIYTQKAAKTMTDVLETCVTAYGATAVGCKLDQDIPVACKTGTTSSYVDGWLCGYSPYYTTAVWVGMDLFKSVDNLKGNTYPAYIWTDFMNTIHRNIERDRELESHFGIYLGNSQEGTTQNQTPTTEAPSDETEQAPADTTEDTDGNETMPDEPDVPETPDTPVPPDSTETGGEQEEEPQPEEPTGTDNPSQEGDEEGIEPEAEVE